jgi:hypothetical protein
MQEWIYESLPRNSRIYLLEGYNVPLDTSVYSYEQNFNIIGFRLEALEGYDYLVLSDARLNLYGEADELVTDEEFQRYRDRLNQIESTYPRLAWIERPTGFFGENNMMNTMTYWHHPSLTIYCLNDVACSP